jgi:hypothetical protein
MRIAEPAQTPLHEAIDHDQTSVMPAAQAQALAKSGEPHEAPDDDDLRQTMRRDADDRVTSVGESSEPMTAEAITEAPTEEPADLPVAIGMRVRIFTAEGGVWVVPEGPNANDGVAAILVPQDAATDLRAFFVKK